MKLTHILPFMETEELKELAIKVVNEEVKGVKLMTLFPFLSRESLDEIVELLIQKGKGREITSILPFASKKSVKRILEGIKDGSITGVKENFLYPFLGEEELKEMFDVLVKQAHDNAEAEDNDDDDLEDLED